MRSIRHAVVLGIFSLIVLSSLAKADQPATQPATSFDLSGPWMGVFAIDNATYLAEVDLKSTDNRGGLSGDIHFTLVVITAAGGRKPAAVEGSWRVVATTDRAARTIALVQQGWTKQSANQPFTLADMAGVYSAGRDEFAGQLTPRGQVGTSDQAYFLFVRAGAAPGRAEAVAGLKKLAEHTLPPEPVGRSRTDPPPPAPPTPPTDAALSEWAARYEKEYPGSAKKDRIEKIMIQSMPLLNDAAFKPVFGDTYDAVDFQMLAATIQRFQGDPRGHANLDFAHDHGYLEYVIRPTAPRIISVAAMRTIDAWQAESLVRLGTDPVTVNTFADIAATQKAIQERMPYAWATDRKHTDETLEKIRTPKAGSALDASADRAVATASGIAGVRSLAGWAKANQAILDRAEPAARAAAQGRVDAQLDKLLSELLKPYEAQLGRMTSGVDAVTSGAAFYAAVGNKFGFVANRPPFHQIMDHFAARRADDLAAAQAMLLVRIQTSASPADIDRIFADLRVPGDEKTPGYPILVAAKEKRIKEFETVQLLATFSDEEQKLMDRPGHIDLSKYKQTAPSRDDARLALLRAYAADKGKMIDAHTARCEIAFPVIVTIPDIDKKNYAFHETEDKKGFACLFQVPLELSIPPDTATDTIDPNTRQGAEAAVKVLNDAIRAKPDTYEVILRLGEDGWQIPEMRDGAALGKVFKGR